MSDSMKILLIENKKTEAKAIISIVKESEIDAEFTIKYTLKTALEILNKVDFDCIFLDFELAIGEGLRFIQTVRSNGIKIPIIIVNSKEGEQIVLDLVQAGATDYIIRGFVSKHNFNHILDRSMKLVKLENENEEYKILRSELEERHLKVLEAAPVGLVTFDKNGHIIDWNPQAELLFGYSSEEIIGKSFFDTLFSPEDAETIKKDFENFYKSGEGVFVNNATEAKLLHKDLTPFSAQLLISATKLNNNRLFIVFINDLTKIKAHEDEMIAITEELQRSNIDLEQFAYTASHDLQEPLRMISGFTKMLESKSGESFDPDSKEYLGFIKEGAARMKKLIEDLLDFSRIGRQQMEISQVDVNEILKQVSANFERYINEKGAKIEWQEMPVILGNQSQIYRLFQNLISNGLKFQEKKSPKIKIKYLKKKNEHCFEVKDNGIGIKLEFAEQIFGIFNRLHSRSTFDGTGLGLAICKKIVELHGGKIRVKSTFGKGSTFYFTIREDLQILDKKDPLNI